LIRSLGATPVIADALNLGGGRIGDCRCNMGRSELADRPNAQRRESALLSRSSVRHRTRTPVPLRDRTGRLATQSWSPEPSCRLRM